MPDLAYRPANLADVPAMSRIRALEWGTEPYWVDRIAGYMNGVQHPQKALPQRVVYVATEADQVIGFIAGHLTERHGCSGELEWINVVPEYRGSGAASSMLRLLAAWFVEQGAARICVNAAPDNPIALRFYIRHGATKLNEYWLVWDDISHVLRP